MSALIKINMEMIVSTSQITKVTRSGNTVYVWIVGRDAAIEVFDDEGKLWDAISRYAISE
jgi:hypothetical protein